jgi:hypothetical protein
VDTGIVEPHGRPTSRRVWDYWPLYLVGAVCGLAMLIGSRRIVVATDNLALTSTYIVVVGLVWAVLGTYLKRRIDRQRSSDDPELRDRGS